MLKKLLKASALLASPIVAWVGYSALFIDHNYPLPPPFLADIKQMTLPNFGSLTYFEGGNVDANGRPLVLIHSINAAASSFEMKPIYEHYQAERHIYSLELPGFGMSDRPNTIYTPQLYAQAITQFLQDVVGEPADVVALSLGCEFVARSAVEAPDLYGSIVFISPTGLSGGAQADQTLTPNEKEEPISGLLRNRVIGRSLYDMLVSKVSLRYFLRQSFAGPIAPEFVEYGYASSHQTGAQYAPFHFVSGRLFSKDAQTALYEPLTMPVLAITDPDGFVRYSAVSGLVASQSNWQTEELAGKGLPQWEVLEELTAVMDSFWQQ